MKNCFCYLCFSLLIILIHTPSHFSKSLLLLNRIEGVVYNPNRVPTNNVRVELYSDAGSFLTTTVSRGGGRFSFMGITEGRYIVKAIPVGLNFLEESVSVDIVNITRRSSDVAYADIYLRYDKRSESSSFSAPPEAIFVQEIPNEAKKLYQTGIESLKKNQDKGLSEIDEAIKVFPNYFEALSRLGNEYNNRKDYQKAYPYLIKAVDINPRSTSNYYSLAYAFFQIGQIPAALLAAKATTILASNYSEAQLLYGILLRMDKKYKEAEITLLKAKSLAKKPIPEIHWQLALLYNKLNRNEEAANELETYLKISPDSSNKKNVQDLVVKLRSAKTKLND